MIEFKKCYVSSGQTFSSLRDAQTAELTELFKPYFSATPDEANDLARDMAEEVMAKSAAILNILTTDANSRPRARKANGATRKGKAPEPTIPEVGTIPPSP